MSDTFKPEKFTFDVRQAAELAHAFERNGWTNADIKKLSAGDMLARLLLVVQGRVEVTAQERPWREENGVIYFTVVSDGTSGPDWIPRLEKQDFRLSGYAKDVLRSPDFKPTHGVTYNVAVLKGELFSNSERITSAIRAEAKHRQMPTPNAEVACLIRETFSDAQLEAMGLWAIIAMHEPIADSGGVPSVLRASRRGDGQWLDAYCDEPGRGWGRGDGFAFLASQVGPGDSNP